MFCATCNQCHLLLVHASIQHEAKWEMPLLLFSAASAAADVVDLKREHQRALLARTLYGHVQNLLGYILSLYCIYRWVWGPAGAAACRHISTACQLASRSFEPARQHRGSAPLTSTTLVRCPCLQDVCQREGPAGGGGPEQRPGEQDAGICAAPIQRRPPGDRRAPVQPISGAGFYWVHIHLQPQVGGVRGVWADGGLVGPELLHGQRAACLAVRRSAPVDTLHNAPSVPFPTHITLPAICAGAS